MPDAERVEMINGMPAAEWNCRFNPDGSRREPKAAKPATTKKTTTKKTTPKKPAAKVAPKPGPAVPDDGVKSDAT